MIKQFFAILLLAVLMTQSVQAAVSLRYYNKDSQTHKMDVKISGSSKTVTFGSSRSSSVTIQGGSSSADIKTSCGTVTVKSGDKIEIKKGCIKIK